MRHLSALLALLACVPRLAAATELETAVSARVSANAQVDTNPSRDFVPNPTVDIALNALGSLGLQSANDRLRVSARYDVGGRQFIFEPSLQTFVQNLDASLDWALGKVVSVGVDGSIKDRRGADHPYSDLLAGARVTLTLDAHASVYLRVGAERFIYRELLPLDDGFRYSFATADFSGGATYRFDRHHALGMQLAAQPRRYNAFADAAPNEQPTGDARRDSVLSAGVSYSYRGPFQVSLSYGYLGADSNSFGETAYRHHVTVLGGFRLPWELLLLAQGNVQLADYPDGMFFSGSVALLQDDESTNSASVKLVRPISKRFDFEVKGAFYEASLPQNQLHYQRWVAGAGVTFRWP